MLMADDKALKEYIISNLRYLHNRVKHLHEVHYNLVFEAGILSSIDLNNLTDLIDFLDRYKELLLYINRVTYNMSKHIDRFLKVIKNDGRMG